MVGLKVKQLLAGKTLSERREIIRSQPDVSFIDPETFCQMVVSCQKLTRADESAAGLKGLFCEEDQTFYFVEEERFDSFLGNLDLPNNISMELVP